MKTSGENDLGGVQLVQRAGGEGVSADLRNFKKAVLEE